MNNNDPSEPIRREAMAEINANPNERAALENKHGRVWTTAEMSQDFEAIGFMAPFIMVKRKSDGKRGTLTFQHYPRYYFDFKEE